MLSKNKSLVNTNQKGSSLSLPAHGRAGAKAAPFLAALFAKQKTKFGGGKTRAGKNSWWTLTLQPPSFLPARAKIIKSQRSGPEAEQSSLRGKIFAEKGSPQ